ncbi:rhamnose-binding lectin-like [Trichomycterus rosablanca]|uniref:rhamnose-binding lectin-like n=1 Tax=Trichomycterus rosablanca TaxID=2290929 RepID=UPI002F35C508
MMFLKLSLLTLLIVAPALLVSAENVISCDGNVQRLTCESGVIRMQTVLYGRRTQNLCFINRTAAELANTSCIANITSTIISRCNGLRECEYNTDKLNLTDPCSGIHKYFNTTYTCVSARTNVVCENSYSTIYCGNDTITILNAVYGRSNPTTCINGYNSSVTSNVNCSSDARSNVSALCDGQTKCTLYSTSNNFEDKCPDTKKYLTVNYFCNLTPNPNVTKTFSVCQGLDATIDCGNRTIHVNKANYGRTDSTVCSTGVPICQISTTNCYKTDSLLKVAQICNDKNSCVVPVTNEFFGEPCYGTNKYLSIDYNCV